VSERGLRLARATVQHSFVVLSRQIGLRALKAARAAEGAWHTVRVQRDCDPIEDRAAETHRRIAGRIRQDPALLAEARARLEQRIAREGPPADPVLREWLDVLLMLDPPQVADFIESTTPRARRLRISSPLVWLSR